MARVATERTPGRVVSCTYAWPTEVEAVSISMEPMRCNRRELFVSSSWAKPRRCPPAGRGPIVSESVRCCAIMPVRWRGRCRRQLTPLRRLSVNVIWVVADTPHQDHLRSSATIAPGRPRWSSWRHGPVRFDRPHIASFATMPARADYFTGRRLVRRPTKPRLWLTASTMKSVGGRSDRR